MVKEGYKPELIIIAGPNGSGKTSVTKRFLHHEWAEGTTYINPDEVANDMFGDWNSRDAVLSAANYCAEWRERCLVERKSFVFETVMSAIDKVDFIAKANSVKDIDELIRLLESKYETEWIPVGNNESNHSTFQMLERGEKRPAFKKP